MEIFNRDYWTGERARRLSLLARKPVYNHLLDTIPSMLNFACLYPEVMRSFDINGDTDVVENVEVLTCSKEKVREGSEVTYYFYDTIYSDNIVKQNDMFALPNHNLFYESLQELVDIHVIKVLNY